MDKIRITAQSYEKIALLHVIFKLRIKNGRTFMLKRLCFRHLAVLLQNRLFYGAKLTVLQPETVSFTLQNSRFCF